MFHVLIYNRNIVRCLQMTLGRYESGFSLLSQLSSVCLKDSDLKAGGKILVLRSSC